MSNPLVVVTDPATQQFHKLYAPRLEAWFNPNEDGSPSASGRLRFYTEWWFFRDGARYAKEPGPYIEHDFDTMMARTWTLPDGTVLTTPQILMAIEAVMVSSATEQLTVVEAVDEPQPEMPVVEPDPEVTP